MELRTFFANAVCGMIPGKKKRDIVRIKIKYHKYLRDCIKFALAHTDERKHTVKIDVGPRSHNLVLIVDKLCVFKFPLHDNGYDKATREKRIVDTFSPISPIKIPNLELYKWNDITVRKYEFVNGVLLKKLRPSLVTANRKKIASQLAQFIFDIGCSDPTQIRDLKPKPNAKPGFLYGWFHNDIAENFFINPDTCEITGFIDWEDAKFIEFGPVLNGADEKWTSWGFDGLMDDVIREYSKLYKKAYKQC